MSLKPGSPEHRQFYAAFAKASYLKPHEQELPAGFQRDSELSNRNRQIFYNPESKHVVMSERGTVLNEKQFKNSDLGNDALLALNLHHFSSRFKNSTATAKKTKKKYNDYDFTVTGHSAGGSAAQYVNRRLGVTAVTYSAHMPTSTIAQEALRTIIKDPKKLNAHNYSTIADPIGIGMVLSGRSYVVKQTDKNAHSLNNFLY